MRAACYGIVLLLALGGCTPPTLVAGTVVSAASVMAFQRAPTDMVVGAVTGRDCSIVHFEQGTDYCKSQEPPPQPQQFCQRTLGAPECFANPASLPDHPMGLADGPNTLSAAQERNRTARWPDFNL